MSFQFQFPTRPHLNAITAWSKLGPTQIQSFLARSRIDCKNHFCVTNTQTQCALSRIRFEPGSNLGSDRVRNGNENWNDMLRWEWFGEWKLRVQVFDCLKMTWLIVKWSGGKKEHGKEYFAYCAEKNSVTQVKFGPKKVSIQFQQKNRKHYHYMSDNVIRLICG